MAWLLKQGLLKELHTILHHEKYTDTALLEAKGDYQSHEICKELNDYIIKTNASTHQFKVQIDRHLQWVINSKVRMENEPCPCEWEIWSEWSKCSTTCQAGKSHRERKIGKPPINGGLECEVGTLEERTCNQYICCREFKLVF